VRKNTLSANPTYLLIAIAKKKLDMAISLYTFAQTMGLTLFEKTPIKELFNNSINLNNLSDCKSSAKCLPVNI